jgi:hypothetical protein
MSYETTLFACDSVVKEFMLILLSRVILMFHSVI